MVDREVNVWRRLQHPNVLPLIGICTLDSVTYMVSPWMSKGNAFNYIKSNPEIDRLLLVCRPPIGLIAYVRARL